MPLHNWKPFKALFAGREPKQFPHETYLKGLRELPSEELEILHRQKPSIYTKSEILYRQKLKKEKKLYGRRRQGR